LELSNTKAQELEETLKKITSGLQESKNSSQMYETELVGLKHTIADLRSHLEEKTRDFNRIKDVNTNQYSRISKLESNLSETLGKLGISEIALRELSNLKSLLAHRTELNRDLEMKLTKQNEKITGLESQIAGLLLRLETSDQQNRSLQEEILRIQENFNEQTGGQFFELKKEMTRLTETLKSKQEKVTLLEVNISHLEQNKINLVKENKSLISELSNIEQTMKELKIALESNDQYKKKGLIIY